MIATSDYDLLIVGGGPVGLVLACALSGHGLRMAVLEDSPPRVAAEGGRSFALAHASQQILDSLDLWNGLDATPIHRVHVSERGRYAMVRLDRHDYALPALGQVVDAGQLNQWLRRRRAELSDVDWLCPACPEAVSLHPDEVCLRYRNGDQSVRLSARLLVAADGGRSRIRELLAIPTLRLDYGQAAVTANLSMTLPHRNIAYERFTDEGPLALLPLAENRCALVYIVAAAELADTLALRDAEFARRVEDRFGERLGRITAVSQRAGHSLSLVRARLQGRQRTLVIGNASHTLHPIAGQGLNLGLRDAATLAELIAQARRTGTDIGNPALCQRYAELRRRDQDRALVFTDLLARLFVNPLPLVGSARTMGLGLCELLPPVKRQLGLQSLGLQGRVPRLALGLPLLDQGP